MEVRNLVSWSASAALSVMRFGVVIHTYHGELVRCNAAAEAMLGVTADRLPGRAAIDPAWPIVSETGEPLRPRDSPVMRCLGTGEPVTDQIIGVHRPDGELRWLRVDAQPLRDRTGAMQVVVTVFEDVTAQRATSADLARSENRLSRTRTAGGVGLWEWNTADGSIWHDDAFVSVLGTSIANVHDLKAVVGLDVFEHLTSRMIESGGREELTVRVVGPDGRVRWIAVAAEVVAAPGGYATRVAGSIVDLSALHDANARARGHLDAMTDGYFTLASDWTFGFVNNQAAAFLGRDPGKMLGTNMWTEFPEGRGSAFEVFYERAMAGEHVECEEFYTGLDAWYEMRAHPLPDGGIAVYFRDVTERRHATQEREGILALAEQARIELAHAATHDPLTQLPNRAALATWLDEQFDVNDAARTLSVLFIDLDRFKLINDSHGHGIGDVLLREVSCRLLNRVRAGDIVARLGGDEFVVAVTCTETDDLDAITARIMEAFANPFEIHNGRFVVTASIGIASVTSVSDTPETLIRNADTALYRAKDSGRNRVVLFDSAMRDLVLQRVAIEADLRDALSRGDIIAHYQPIFGLASGRVDGAELLARWTGSNVGPDEFIPVAEEAGLIHDLGDIMFRAAADSLRTIDAGFATDSRVWVNVSGRQLNRPRFAQDLVAWTEQRGICGRLGIEITESVLADDTTTTVTALHRLAEAGFLVAIDDFGTGYSSLARLAQYPVHMLKIDRAFIANMSSPKGIRIVAAIVDLAHALGATACAEGIETAEQLAIVHDLGVDKASGYYLSPAVPLRRFTAATQLGTRQLAAAADQTIDGFATHAIDG